MCYGGDWEKARLLSSEDEIFTEKGRERLVGRIGNVTSLEALMRDEVSGN